MRRIKRDLSLGLVPGLCKAVDEICEVLPSLEITGDNKTTFVDHSIHGVVIRSKSHATNPSSQTTITQPTYSHYAYLSKVNRI